jgi:hypothetical protein
MKVINLKWRNVGKCPGTNGKSKQITIRNTLGSGLFYFFRSGSVQDILGMTHGNQPLFLIFIVGFFA